MPKKQKTSLQKATVLIVYTGGTIGMKKTNKGYEPAPGYLAKKMKKMQLFQAHEVPNYTILDFNPLLDSSNMTPADWLKIATTIMDNYEEYDGFLVLHGTDTMAYTASALSFMLENLCKPILISGSQIPLVETRNDAQENLLTSLMILGDYHKKLPGVYLYFADQLFRGNRTTKVDADGFSAFGSPNFPPVGTVGINIDIDHTLVHTGFLSANANKLPSIVKMGQAVVAVVRLFPGLHADYLENILSPPVQGVVMECFGAGNGPDQNKAFMKILEKATKKHDIVIVDVTQPLKGCADLSLYATGQALRDAGVVSGYDMTTEAALAKLFYLFEKGHEPKKVKKLIQQDLCGELTLPSHKK